MKCALFYPSFEYIALPTHDSSKGKKKPEKKDRKMNRKRGNVTKCKNNFMTTSSSNYHNRDVSTNSDSANPGGKFVVFGVLRWRLCCIVQYTLQSFMKVIASWISSF